MGYKPLGRVMEGKRVWAKLNSGRYRGMVEKYFPHSGQGPMYKVHIEGHENVKSLMLKEWQIEWNDEEEVEVQHG